MGGARLLWAKIAQRHGLVEDDLGRIASFWHIYNDPVLDVLEHEAAENNQDLRAAVARVTQARAQARIAKADFFPTLTLDPSHSWSRLSPNILNPLPLAQGNDINVPLDLSYELDLWGRVRRSFEASNADAQARQAAFENTLLVLKADVAQSYSAIRTLDSERSILRNTIELRRESLKLVNSLSRGGAASDLDVSQAETELDTTAAALLALDRHRADLEHAMAVLEGKPASEFTVKELPLAATTPLPVIPAGLPGDLLERRPDIAEAERALAASNARIGVATGAFFPVVRLTGAAGFESMDVETLFNWQSKAWSLGPSITLPLFEGGRIRANLKRSRAAYEESVATYRQQVLVAFKEVQDALTDSRLLNQQAQAQDRSTASAHRTADISNSRYRAGLVSYLEVVESERTALDAERESARLTGQRLVTSVQLIKALGGGWADSSLPKLAISR
jgi:multidrug efflux system outer membrane protein